MKFLFLFFVLFPYYSFCQNFQERNNIVWDSSFAKAKLEGKLILIEVSAPWCTICREMETQVLRDSAVNDYINKRFVLLKVNGDLSKIQAESDKYLLNLRGILEKCKVKSFPTFLVLTANEKPVHKIVGKMSVVEFISNISDAFNPELRYYSVEENRFSLISENRLYDLIEAYKSSDDTVLLAMASRFLVERFLNGYSLEKFINKPKAQSFLKENAFVIRETDPIFRLIHAKRDSFKSDESSFDFFRSSFSEIVLVNEFKRIKDSIGNDVSWNLISNRFQGQYDVNLLTTVSINARLSWYLRKMQLDSAAHYLIRKIGKIDDYPNDVGTLINLNNAAFFVFKNSSNHEDLNRALVFTEKALEASIVVEGKPSAAVLDTKANLLYKLGKKTAAIKVMKEVVNMLPEVEEFGNNLTLMKKNLPTWK